MACGVWCVNIKEHS